MARAAAAPATPLPPDVRLMHVSASVAFVIAGMVLAAAVVLWLARLPVFSLKSIRLEGEIVRNSVSTIRANATPQLSGNFFTLDLGEARAAFESVPWVRHAVVRRIWPNRLAVRLEEHHAAALWAEENGNDKLVNTAGEVFEANVGDVEDDGLPRFSGPEGSAAQMLQLYGRLQPVLQALDEGGIESMKLSGRGSWRVVLDGGAVLELGRGSDDDVITRAGRFVRTVQQVVQQYERPLQYADLRHPDGYAVRLKGVTTLMTPPPPARKR
jgi:cell division protein FtsQ